jgi:hypothetical protein
MMLQKTHNYGDGEKICDCQGLAGKEEDEQNTEGF